MWGPEDIRGTPHKGDRQGGLTEKGKSNAWGLGELKRDSLSCKGRGS